VNDIALPLLSSDCVQMTMRVSISEAIDAKFDCYEWRNGLAILRHVHATEFTEISAMLDKFRLLHSDLAAKGRGNKSEISKQLDGTLYGMGWSEKSFDTQIAVDGAVRPTPTHSIDCFKGRVALEIEWNNKDPFYDRDLNNFRLLYDLQVIDVGVVVTRTSGLQQWLHANHKSFGKDSGTYGSSTTHDDKLKPRILGGGAGGCPLVVCAINKEAYVDDRK
jgi:Restriction endonuclease BglII